MKVIAGEHRGRKLRTVSGTYTRPTSSRVKESVFNILSNRVIKSNVLDLFAGSGALGIEALSRGADTAIFIDWSQKVVANIRCNISNLDLENRTRVLRWDILRNLNCLRSLRTNFEIIFIDPPYNRDMIKPTLINLVNANIVMSKTCVVVEHNVQEVLPDYLYGLVLLDQRNYGETCVSFLFSVK